VRSEVLPFTNLVHRFFSVEHQARRKERTAESEPRPPTHQPEVPSRSGHPTRDGMRRWPVLADWTSHVFVHEHPRNCSYRMRSCKTDAHALADNCSHGTKSQNIPHQGEQVSERPQEKNAARLHIFA
jgi:hypothetical protein